MGIKTYLKIIICFLIVLISKNHACAQSDEDVNGVVSQQIWLDLYPHIIISEKLQYTGDFGFRKMMDENSWARLFLRPSLRYQVSDLLSFQGSVNISYDWSKTSTDHLIVTPRQGIRLDWPTFVRFSFNHLIRLEERISYNASDWSNTFSLRARYRLYGNFDFRLNENGKYWFIPFYGEVFLRSDEDKQFIRNQVRVGLGVGFDPSNDWKYIFMLNWQGSQTSDEATEITDMIFQLKIYRTLRKWSKN